jgi:hypothetical protein
MGFAWKKKASGQLEEWKTNWGPHWLDTSVSCFFPCARTINGIGRICIILHVCLTKILKWEKRKRTVCFWAHREWCARLKVSCVCIDWHLIVNSFFHPTYCGSNGWGKKKDCMSVTQMSPSCQISFPYPQNVETEAKEDNIMNKRKKKKKS